MQEIHSLSTLRQSKSFLAGGSKATKVKTPKAPYELRPLMTNFPGSWHGLTKWHKDTRRLVTATSQSHA